MSWYEKIKNPPPMSDLPLWRKVVMACALGFAVLMPFASLHKELTIYGAAPDHPVPETGQIYEVFVNKGSIRYVTLAEKESPFLDGDDGSWAVVAFMTAYFLWITSRKKTNDTGRFTQVSG